MVIVTWAKILKEEARVFLSHFSIYLEQIFGIVIWETFTHDYRASMSNFTYCLKKQCTIETTMNDAISCTSFIDINDSTNFLNNLVFK